MNFFKSIDDFIYVNKCSSKFSGGRGMFFVCMISGIGIFVSSKKQ